MAVQQQMSSFAGRLGAKVAQAHQEHHDKPIDTGSRRLPPNIRRGIAKLSSLYTKQQDKDDGMVPKGETFFRASATVVWPKQHNGELIEGMITQQLVPLCDTPAKGLRKAKSFSDHWFDFQNLFKILGVMPPNEQGNDDAASKRIEAYYFAAMKALVDPQRPPVYVVFSTRGWTPPKLPGATKEPEEIVFETWHELASEKELAELNGKFDPGAGVTAPPAPGGMAAPPTGPLHTPLGPPPKPPQEPDDREELVAELVEIASNDPGGETQEGAQAGAQLEDMAWANGWDKQQTGSASSWEEVGEMALNPPTKDGAAPNGRPAVTVGSEWKFSRRTRDGSKLKDNKGNEFAPQDVVVSSVNEASQTCHVKTKKDGKDVLNLRGGKPVEVKWEWLE